MPTDQTDFHFSIERCAGLTLDATCAARTAASGRLPASHRRQLRSITRDLESAQDKLFSLKEYPWSQKPPSSPQLELAL